MAAEDKKKELIEKSTQEFQKLNEDNKILGAILYPDFDGGSVPVPVAAKNGKQLKSLDKGWECGNSDKKGKIYRRNEKLVI